MKKHLAILLLALSSLFAQVPKGSGIPVSVTLVTGVSQNAEYLGSTADTVFLGGTIADTFTVVKILENRISLMLGESGDTLSKARADSILQNIPANETAKAVQPDTLPDISGKALVFPVFRRAIDSALAERLRDLEAQLLTEQGDRVQKVSTSDFPDCKDSPCIAAEAEKRNAQSVWTAEITPAAHQDSLEIRIHRFLVREKAQSSEHLTVSSKNATGELLSENRFVECLQKVKGIRPKAKKEVSLQSFISVETDPEGANLAIKGKDILCQTPCTFPLTDTGKVQLEAFWDVDRTLWANRATIRPVPGDTAHVNMHLKRVVPEVEIRTVPSGARIFGEAEIDPSSRPIGKTPKKLFSEEPGPAQIRLWKEGFRDSVVNFYINATEKTVLEIRLDSIRNPEELKKQEVFRTIQKRIFWGHLSLGCAIAPAVAGGILLYLAEKDRDKAKSIKKELEMPSSGGGKNFTSKVRENHRYADRSKNERIVGTGFLVLAGGLLGAGLILSF